MTTFKFIRPTTVTDSAGSFTRSTTATYFDVAGVMQQAAINVPRIGYDPVTHAHTGLIIEAAATNLLTYSEQFDNAAWTKTNATITANSLAAPDGTTTADLQTVTATGTLGVFQTVAISVNTTYTASVYFKAGTSAYLQLSFSDNVDSGCNGWVHVSTFAVYTSPFGGWAVTALTVTSVGGGWYRAALTCTSNSSDTSTSVYVSQANSSSLTTATPTGTAGQTIYTWGAQLEAGSVATSYIPTTSAAVTRAADIVTGSGLIYTDVPENDYPAWVGGTTYTALTSYVIRTTATTHKVYQCLVTHTAAATPEDNTTGVTPKWLEIGPTNRWGLFDKKVSTSTTKASSMTYLLKPGRVNSLAFLGVDADSVEVSLISNNETVYVASIDLNSGNTVGDWYQYFYEPIYQVDAVAITNLLDATLMSIPAYGDGVLCIRFLASTGDVTCGVLAVGLYAELGLTKYSPKIGIVDYSRVTVDEFGVTTVIPRDFAKKMSCDVELDPVDVDNVARLMAQYRGAFVVWVGADNLYTSLIVYGPLQSWDISIDDYAKATLSVQIIGLT